MANRTPKSAWAALFNFAGGGRIHIELFAELLTGMPGSTFLELIAENILLRGTHAARPAVADVPIGTEYFATDTGLRWKSNGASWLADGTSVASGSATIYQATITITNAQMLAWDTTAIMVVAAKGAGKAIMPILAHMVTNLTTDYTNLQAAGIIFWGYTDNTYADSGPLNQAGLDPNLKTPNSISTFSDPNNGINVPIGIPLTSIDNKPLIIALYNDGFGNLTGGNAANTVEIEVYYTIVDV